MMSVRLLVVLALVACATAAKAGVEEEYGYQPWTVPRSYAIRPVYSPAYYQSLRMADINAHANQQAAYQRAALDLQHEWRVQAQQQAQSQALARWAIADSNARARLSAELEHNALQAHALATEDILAARHAAQVAKQTAQAALRAQIENSQYEADALLKEKQEIADKVSQRVTELAERAMEVNQI